MQITPMKKLEILLEKIQKKLWMHQSLTPQEANLAAELARTQHLNPQEQIHADHDGNVTITKTLNSEPILEGVAALSDTLPRHHGGAAGARYVGSIDPLTAQNWAKEWGCAIGTKEFGKLASIRIKSDRDYSRFKYQPN